MAIPPDSQPTPDSPPIFGENLEGFLSLATHQLRSPLTTMSWTLDLLLNNLDTEPRDKLRHKLEVINHSTHTMIGLVNDMLTVARINHNAVVEDPRPCLVSELLQTILEELHSLAEPKHVQVEINITSPELQSTKYNLDASWFHVCFHNLISNAIRYSNDGGYVKVTAFLKDGLLCVEIKDNGIGIPEADIPHIFDKFFRGQNIHNENDPGSGLGLFIVQSIVQHWNGEITLESQESQGTTVTVCFPVTPAT